MDEKKTDSGIIAYDYIFKFQDGYELEFGVQLEKHSLSLIPKTQLGYPEWIILGHHKCPSCPFDEKIVNYCPVAKNLVQVIDAFKGVKPDALVDLSINSPMRNYAKHTTVEEGMSSLIGIYMVTSGCPYLDKLRPMVKSHLPFANKEETRYRAITMYLMAQYLLYKKGKSPDWDLKHLYRVYKDIQVVNKSFCERLIDSPLKKASINALLKLDCFAGDISTSIVDNQTLLEIEEFFNAYL